MVDGRDAVRDVRVEAALRSQLSASIVNEDHKRCLQPSASLVLPLVENPGRAVPQHIASKAANCESNPQNAVDLRKNQNVPESVSYIE